MIGGLLWVTVKFVMWYGSGSKVFPLPWAPAPAPTPTPTPTPVPDCPDPDPVVVPDDPQTPPDGAGFFFVRGRNRTVVPDYSKLFRQVPGSSHMSIDILALPIPWLFATRPRDLPVDLYTNAHIRVYEVAYRVAGSEQYTRLVGSMLPAWDPEWDTDFQKNYSESDMNTMRAMSPPELRTMYWDDSGQTTLFGASPTVPYAATDVQIVLTMAVSDVSARDPDDENTEYEIPFSTQAHNVSYDIVIDDNSRKLIPYGDEPI